MAVYSQVSPVFDANDTTLLLQQGAAADLSPATQSGPNCVTTTKT